MADYSYNNNGKRGGGRAWLWATLILVAFIGGILISQGINSARNQPEVLPTYTPEVTQSPQATQAPTPQETDEPQATVDPDESAAPQPTADAGDDLQGQLEGQAASVPDIVERVASAVVGINNNVHVSSRYDFTTQEVTQSSGSGVVISEDGYIITNAHVIDQAETVMVVFENGEQLEADVVGYDTRSDLALLKIDKTGLNYMKIGDSDELRVGEYAIAIGNPLGQKLAGTVTLGVISAVDRVVTDSDGLANTMLQTDAAINPGNSGGALVNLKGELIGINTAKSAISNTTYAEGIGFAIPSKVFQPIIDELKSTGTVARPFIGISGLQNISQAQAEYNNVPIGVYVERVTDGPAKKAGMKNGDIITKFNGVEITSYSDLLLEVDKTKVGETVEVEVYRMSDKQSHTFTLELENKADYDNMSTVG